MSYNCAIVIKYEASLVKILLYQYAHSQKNEIKRLIREMLFVDIVQSSFSSYFSLVILVKKKDGGWSFYVDYKAPNTINIPSKSLILIIKEFLDKLHDAR